jgi:hypothetical protein
MDLAKTLHPAVRKAINEFKARMYWPQTVANCPDKDLYWKVMAEHGSLWSKAYGKQMAAVIATECVLAFGMFAVLKSAGSPGDKVAFAMVIAFGIAAIMVTWTVRNKRRLTAPELRNLLPVMGLSRTHAAYCEAVLAIRECKLLEKRQAEEMIGQLNTLVDIDEQLEATRAGLTGALGLESLGAQASAECDDLRARLAAASDPEARKALEQGLALAERRCKGSEDLAPTLARLDAQQELIHQTIRTAHESVARLSVAPRKALAIDLEALRQSVAQVGEQASAVERAVDEVLQLGAGS